MAVKLSVNGREVEVDEGSYVLDAVNASGVYISQLCKDPDMKAIAACRTCLVQIDGVRGFPASCSVPAADGMQVRTDATETVDLRRGVLELTMAMLEPNGKREYKELTIAAERHGLQAPRWNGRDRQPIDTSNPVFNIAMSDCIMCGRCAQACQDGHQFIGAIDVLGVGADARIGTFMDKPLLESVCTTCGQCLSVCPTGAIELKVPVPNPVKTVSTVCPYCGVGCGIKAEVDENDRILRMLDDPDNQSSLGMLCVKGRFGYTFVHHKDRLTTPLVRRNGELTPATWEEAMNVIAERLPAYRGDSFATFCSAKCTNEDGYVQQKFARLVMGSNHIDHCTRLCHAPSVEGHAHLARQRRHQQLVRRLRGGRLPGHYRLRRQLQPSGRRISDAPRRRRARREAHRHQPAPHRHVRLRRPVASPPPRHRRRSPQRHCEGHTRRGPIGPRVR